MTEARGNPSELYRALLVSGRIPQLRRMTYRCSTSARCLLLDAVETPMGVLLHQVRYKYSPDENVRRSSEDGRRANTFDGVNHWRDRTYWIEQSALSFPADIGMRLGVSCDHVLDVALMASDFHADWSAGHAEVMVRADHSRYAIE